MMLILPLICFFASIFSLSSFCQSYRPHPSASAASASPVMSPDSPSSASSVASAGSGKFYHWPTLVYSHVDHEAASWNKEIAEYILGLEKKVRREEEHEMHKSEGWMDDQPHRMRLTALMNAPSFLHMLHHYCFLFLLLSIRPLSSVRFLSSPAIVGAAAAAVGVRPTICSIRLCRWIRPF